MWKNLSMVCHCSGVCELGLSTAPRRFFLGGNIMFTRFFLSVCFFLVSAAATLAQSPASYTRVARSAPPGVVYPSRVQTPQPGVVQPCPPCPTPNPPIPQSATTGGSTQVIIVVGPPWARVTLIRTIPDGTSVLPPVTWFPEPTPIPGPRYSSRTPLPLVERR
jgi:hypothetical protein